MTPGYSAASLRCRWYTSAGLSDRNGADRVLDKEGFDFIQMGRALINEPDFCEPHGLRIRQPPLRM